jgi:hypothetical protein
MIPELRARFNRDFTPAKYQNFLAQLQRTCGTEVHFRVAETPCFVPFDLLDEMCRSGRELVHQLTDSEQYRCASEAAIPEKYRVPNEARLPVFVQVDFGLVRDPAGKFAPKLVELQAFPSLYGYQAILGGQYIDSYSLPTLNRFFSGLNANSYWELLRQTIIGNGDPRTTILLEIDPLEQKTLPDFLVTQQQLGIPIANIRDVIQRGRKLFFRKVGREHPIERIYNRCIVDELERKGISLPFDLRAETDAHWVGHPNWYFRMSKFSIPYLRHTTVPQTWFLHEVGDRLPLDREQLLLKPLYSFAGVGIQFAPSDADLAAIPAAERHNYILQERMEFTPTIDTPHGPTQMEVRIMYIWPGGGELTPVMPLVRMGRGKMMGVDHNRGLEWVGGGAALWP